MDNIDLFDNNREYITKREEFIQFRLENHILKSLKPSIDLENPLVQLRRKKRECVLKNFRNVCFDGDEIRNIKIEDYLIKENKNNAMEMLRLLFNSSETDSNIFNNKVSFLLPKIFNSIYQIQNLNFHEQEINYIQNLLMILARYIYQVDFVDDENIKLLFKLIKNNIKQFRKMKWMYLFNFFYNYFTGSQNYEIIELYLEIILDTLTFNLSLDHINEQTDINGLFINYITFSSYANFPVTQFCNYYKYYLKKIIELNDSKNYKAEIYKHILYICDNFKDNIKFEYIGNYISNSIIQLKLNLDYDGIDNFLYLYSTLVIDYDINYEILFNIYDSYDTNLLYEIKHNPIAQCFNNQMYKYYENRYYYTNVYRYFIKYYSNYSHEYNQYSVYPLIGSIFSFLLYEYDQAEIDRFFDNDIMTFIQRVARSIDKNYYELNTLFLLFIKKSLEIDISFIGFLKVRYEDYDIIKLVLSNNQLYSDEQINLLTNIANLFNGEHY